MYAHIMSKELRVFGESLLQFIIDENTYSDTCNRQITKTDLLDGTTVISDNGYSVTRKQIILSPELSWGDHDTMIDFKEDNTNQFIFCYREDCYEVVVTSVKKGSISGDKVMTDIVLDVVRKINGNGEYSG